MTDAAPVLGVLAGAIGVADTVPYVRDILRGSTRPHRGTWLIWGVLAIVVCLSQRADGASWSLIMAGTQAVVNALIFLLAIRRGEGGVSAPERIVIALAGIGVTGWVVARDPVVATACVIAADLIAAAMMVPKTYRDPESETLATFAFASLGGALAAGAVGVLDASLLIYPVYYCLVNGAIALVIYQRRCALPCAAWPTAPDPLGRRRASMPTRSKLRRALYPAALAGTPVDSTSRDANGHRSALLAHVGAWRERAPTGETGGGALPLVVADEGVDGRQIRGGGHMDRVKGRERGFR